MHNAAEPLDRTNGEMAEGEKIATHSKLSNSSRDDIGDIERASVRHVEPVASEKALSQVSLDLRRTVSRASNVLDRVLTTRSIADPGLPPDGGLKAWTQVACAWLVIFTTWGWVNSYGAFQTYYTLTLAESASTISWIGTVQNWLTFFIGAFSGRLLDAGLYVPTFIVGAVLQLLGMFLMSVSTKYVGCAVRTAFEALADNGGPVVASHAHSRRSYRTGRRHLFHAVSRPCRDLLFQQTCIRHWHSHYRKC